MLRLISCILMLLSFSVHAIERCGENPEEKELQNFQWEGFGEVNVETPYGEMRGQLCVGLLGTPYDGYSMAIINFKTKGEQSFYKSWSIVNVQKNRVIAIENESTAKIKYGPLVSFKLSEAVMSRGKRYFRVDMRFVRKLNRMSGEDKRMLYFYVQFDPANGQVGIYPDRYYRQPVNSLSLDVNWWGTVKTIFLKSFDKVVREVETEDLKQISYI